MLVVLTLVRVLVLSPETEPPPPRFVQELGIHLADTAEVLPGPAVSGVTLPAKVDSAVRAVDAGDATLAVWVERGGKTKGGELEFVLYIVGRREGRLLVEVFRVPAKEGPDLDRTLALKVGEVLDRALRKETQTTAANGWLAPEIPETPEPLPATPEPVRQRRWLAELDGRWGGGGDAPASQSGAALAGGVRWRRDQLALEVLLAVGFDGGLEELEDLDGTVTTDEVTAAACARLLAKVGPVWAGGGLSAGARFVDAEGTTPRGTTGSDWIAVPTVTAAADVRFPIGRSLEVRGAAGMEWSPDRVTLTVNQQPVVDLGRVRAVAEVALVFSIP